MAVKGLLFTPDDSRRLVCEYSGADLLGVTVWQMRQWRRSREGPRWRKAGRRALYQVSDLLAFINSLPAVGGSPREKDHE